MIVHHAKKPIISRWKILKFFKLKNFSKPKSTRVFYYFRISLLQTLNELNNYFTFESIPVSTNCQLHSFQQLGELQNWLSIKSLKLPIKWVFGSMAKCMTAFAMVNSHLCSTTLLSSLSKLLLNWFIIFRINCITSVSKFPVIW